MADVTTEQIDAVNKFCGFGTPYDRISFEDGAWAAGMYRKSEWQIVGIVAEAAKKAGVGLRIDTDEGDGTSVGFYRLSVRVAESVNASPAHACILAVAAYLEHNPPQAEGE